MGAQEPPARRSAKLVAVAAQRAGPPYHYLDKPHRLSLGVGKKQDGSELNRRTTPKAGQNSTGVDRCRRSRPRTQ